MYHGENRRIRGLITVYVKEGAKEMEKKDSITLSIKREQRSSKNTQIPQTRETRIYKITLGT